MIDLKLGRIVFPLALVLAFTAAHAELHETFLAAPATSVDQLVSTLKNDSKTESNYTHYFHMGTNDLLQYVKSLRLTSIAEKGLYTAFSSTESGSKPELITLDRGELVFADSSGTAILRASDGAPLVSSSSVETAPGSSATAGAGVLSASLTPTSAVAPQTGEDQGAAPLGFGASYTGVLSGLALLTGGIILSNPNGGTSAGIPNLVPEPAAFLALGVGVAGLMIRRKRN